MGRKKPGPKGLLRNPRPVSLDDEEGKVVRVTDEIEVWDLDDAERDLRHYLGKRRKELVARPGEALSAAVLRIARLATEALSETQAVWWSGYERQRVVDDPAPRRLSRPWGRGGTGPHVGPTPPTKAEHKCLWLDTSGSPAVLKRYDRHSGSWQGGMEVDASIAANKFVAERFVADMTRPVSWDLETSWPLPKRALHAPVARMLRGDMGRAGKSGRPAYLAYATLGALLDTTPEKIADFLHNRRYRRQRPGAQRN